MEGRDAASQGEPETARRQESQSPFPQAPPGTWQQKLDAFVEPFVIKYLWDPRFAENCAFRGVQTFVVGGAMGFVMGIFFSSLGGPSSMGMPDVEMKGGWKKQTAEHFKHMGRSGVSMMKAFAYVGALYATTECVVEKYRGKSDLMNPLIAGCISGGLLASRAGFTATAMGCGGFAAFSVGIDWLMMENH